MDVKDDNVAPWKIDGTCFWLECLRCAVSWSASGRVDVTTATGCAVSRKSSRRDCLTRYVCVDSAEL